MEYISTTKRNWSANSKSFDKVFPSSRDRNINSKGLEKGLFVFELLKRDDCQISITLMMIKPLEKVHTNLERLILLANIYGLFFLSDHRTWQ